MSKNDVVICSPRRTAIGTYGGSLKDVAAADLGARVIAEVVSQSGVRPDLLQSVVMGNVIQAGNKMNPARQAALKGGLLPDVAAMTINKVCGAITLVSAAGSASWQTFTATNSTVAATDTIRVCQKSGTDLNQIHVTAVGAGSFNITFATTGGTTTEQPVFNFMVLKGVAA